MSQPIRASMHNRAEAAGSEPAVANSMANEETRSFWQRHRTPILLGIIAVCLYSGSIVWMIFGRGQVG